MAINPDQTNLTINVGNQSLTGIWNSFSVTRSAMQVPSTLQVEYSEISRTGNPTFLKNQTITAFLGTNQIFAGRIDAVSPRISPGNHSVVMTARSFVREIVDCSADMSALSNGQLINDDVFTAAKKLCAPVGVNVVVTSQQQAQRVPSLIINYGESAWSMIERIARYNGVILLDTVKGELEITDVGLNTHKSSIIEGINAMNYSGNFDGSQQYSDVFVVWSTVDTMTGRTGADATSFRHGRAFDAELKKTGLYRPLFLLSEQTVGGLDIAQARADWEISTRFGRANQVQVSVDSFSDNYGNLWSPNWLVNIDLPAAYVVNQNWAIVSVTYNKSLQSGTSCDITCMPKAGLMPEPISLNNMSVRLEGSEPSGTPSQTNPNPPIAPQQATPVSGGL